MQTARTEFAQALKAIATERGLDPEVIVETIKQAIIAAYRRDAKDRGEDTESLEFEVELDPSNGEARVFAWPFTLDEEGNKKENKDERKDVTPPGFGRIAAQTAKQVIHQKIREAEKSFVMDEYSKKIGGLVSGVILRFDGSSVRVDIGKTEAILPPDERIPSERLSISQRLTFLLKDIIESPHGKEIILSRADPQFVVKLFAREVPEISSGSVEIKAIVREAGIRTKMTVFSQQHGVDPVGSCVGQKGVRVQAVTNELGGERVDVIPFSDDVAELIKASLSPAENLDVVLDNENKTAHVKAPEDQLSLAIGRDGQNARLAAKLTGWRIEVAAEEVKETKKSKEKKEDGNEDEKKVTKKVAKKKTETVKEEKKEKTEEIKDADEKAEDGVDKSGETQDK